MENLIQQVRAARDANIARMPYAIVLADGAVVSYEAEAAEIISMQNQVIDLMRAASAGPKCP